MRLARFFGLVFIAFSLSWNPSAKAGNPFLEGAAIGANAVDEGFGSAGCQRRRGYDHYPTTYEHKNTCSNDYDCEYGSACVKEQYRAEGFCAKKVNAVGVPTFTPPDPSSTLPGGPGNCAWDTDCAPTFKCVKGDGQLRGHCLR